MQRREEASSFILEKNTNVNSVQFVIQREAVEIEEEEPAAVLQNLRKSKKARRIKPPGLLYVALAKEIHQLCW